MQDKRNKRNTSAVGLVDHDPQVSFVSKALLTVQLTGIARKSKVEDLINQTFESFEFAQPAQVKSVASAIHPISTEVDVA